MLRPSSGRSRNRRRPCSSSTSCTVTAVTASLRLAYSAALVEMSRAVAVAVVSSCPAPGSTIRSPSATDVDGAAADVHHHDVSREARGGQRARPRRLGLGVDAGDGHPQDVGKHVGFGGRLRRRRPSSPSPGCRRTPSRDANSPRRQCRPAARRAPARRAARASETGSTGWASHVQGHHRAHAVEELIGDDAGVGPLVVAEPEGVCQPERVGEPLQRRHPLPHFDGDQLRPQHVLDIDVVDDRQGSRPAGWTPARPRRWR